MPPEPDLSEATPSTRHHSQPETNQVPIHVGEQRTASPEEADPSSRNGEFPGRDLIHLCRSPSAKKCTPTKHWRQGR